MNFLENVGFIAIVVVLAIVFNFIFRDVKSRVGRRILGIIFMVVVFVVITKGEELYDSIFSSSIPTPTPTRAPTKRPTSPPAFIASTATRENCYRWDRITSIMEGQEVCAYGMVQAVYITDETWTRIRFTDQPNNFFLFSSNYVFDDLKAGSCVKAYGKVELFESIPFINVGSDLYHCEAWMK